MLQLLAFENCCTKQGGQGAFPEQKIEFDTFRTKQSNFGYVLGFVAKTRTKLLHAASFCRPPTLLDTT